MADLDLVRPLARAGVPCVAVASSGDPVRWSRFTRSFVDRSAWTSPEATLEGLLTFAARQSEPPVLFYANDQDLLLVSRNRTALGERFRFVIADALQVELLVDKTRAQERFEACGFPVPAGWRLRADAGRPPDDLAYPVVLKPVAWEHAPTSGGLAKAVRIDSPAELPGAWAAVAGNGRDVFAQRLIPGGEDRIESYHVYVDAAGDIAGEFAGRKLRTWPVQYGNTTALVITGARDVLDLGRSIVQTLALRGVAKLDFKRDPDGKLWLLEVNPRFNLWHHAGACAGVNLPAMVYNDLVGAERPPVGAPRTGVTWCDPLRDRGARRAAGMSYVRWVESMLRADARWAVDWNDPLPIVRGIAVPFVRRRLRKLVRCAAGRAPRSRRAAS
jgi:D-aspartate ligase